MKSRSPLVLLILFCLVTRGVGVYVPAVKYSQFAEELSMDVDSGDSAPYDESPDSPVPDLPFELQFEIDKELADDELQSFNKSHWDSLNFNFCRLHVCPMNRYAFTPVRTALRI